MVHNTRLGDIPPPEGVTRDNVICSLDRGRRKFLVTCRTCGYKITLNYRDHRTMQIAETLTKCYHEYKGIDHTYFDQHATQADMEVVINTILDMKTHPCK